MGKLTALVVDDERLFCTMISRLLEAEGFQVMRAENGGVAMHVLEERQPDVILLDLEMPEVDGWTFYQECRSAGFDGPVVIISGGGAKKAQRELGAQAALEKPFEIDELLKVVREVVAAA